MSGHRPRVLHVLEALEGGTSRHLIDVVTHATGSDHTVVVPPHRVGAPTDEMALARLQGAGAAIRLVSMHRTPWSPPNGPALRHVRALLRSERPDVVHGHSSIGGLMARLAAVRMPIPTVYTPNGITQVRAGRAVERLVQPLTDVFVAVSDSEAELALRLGLTDRRRVVVVPNGIELRSPSPPVDLRSELGLDSDTPLVGTIARLVPQKAPEDFVAACSVVARDVPAARFVLIGSGELEDRVEAAIDGLGLRTRFHRIPVLPDAAGVLGQLDVFALSSRFEGGPYAPLEAMRAGTAVVLTAVVGSRDAVEDGVSGVIVPPGRPAELAAAVTRLLRDDELRRGIGAAGRERVAARFDVRSMGASLDALYAELCSRGRART